jgi:MOSC domain-containing protein YiiM
MLGQSTDWWHTRRNLLVADVELPRREGALIRVGEEVVLRVTGECDPCRRMNEVIDGLHEAMTPDWRGGVTTKVVSGGHIAVGDPVRIEE